MIIKVEFEVAEQEEPCVYAWQEAVDHLAKKGGGWRLPRKEEAAAMYPHRESITGLDRDRSYWTATETGDYGAWVQCFSKNLQWDTYKEDYKSVRAVRDIA
jgi:hypothetical protein